MSLLAAMIALPALALPRASDLYVGPNGTASGPGTATQPYDLGSALSGNVGTAGDTFWLRGGTYRLGHVDTEIHGTADRPITLRAMPGERAQVIGSLTFWGAAGYVTLRDFELCSGVANRVSRQKDAGFSPKDLTNFTAGIQVYAPNCSFVNLVVHDAVRSGFYTSVAATNTLIYGCIVYNVGWASCDNAEGHSYYLEGAGEIAENLGFNSAGAGFHVYSNGKGECLRNLTLTGNVAFGAGTLQNVRAYRDWIVGVDAPAVTADNITLRNNMGYAMSRPLTLSQVQLGREQINGRLVLSSNYWPQGLVVKNWRWTSACGNLLAPHSPDDMVELDQPRDKLQTTWENNVYCSSSPRGFRFKGKSCSFSEWRGCTGYDSRGCWKPGPLTGTTIFVRPNRYEPGRANIVVYNWDGRDKVAVRVCPVLPAGTRFELRNAQDFFGPPVQSGVFDGGPLELPMKSLTVAGPIGGLKTPSATGPTFNVFVLLPQAGHEASPNNRRAGKTAG